MILSKTDNRLINLLFLSALLIFIKIGPVSASFPVGVVTLLHFFSRIRWDQLVRQPLIWLLFLFFVGTISSIISEVHFDFSVFYMLIQFFYWLLLTCLVGQLYPYLNKQLLSKVIAYCSVLLGLANLFLGVATQNSVAFILVIISPLGVFGFRRSIFKLAYVLILLAIMLFNESRTGMLVLFVEALFIIARVFRLRNMRIVILFVGMVVALIIGNPSIRESIGSMIAPYNTDVAELLTNREGVLTTDKSWLQRRIQIQKGLQIVKKHPYVGIGPGNFSRIDMNIDFSGLDIDDGVLNSLVNKANHRSTHNTYITLLSEFGIIGTVLFALFLLSYFWTVLRYSKYMDDFDYVLFVSTIGMCVYFYTIASLYGTISWLFFGLIYGYTAKNQV